MLNLSQGRTACRLTDILNDNLLNNIHEKIFSIVIG